MSHPISLSLCCLLSFLYIFLYHIFIYLCVGFAKDIVSGPFFAWKELSANAVLRRNQQNGLVNAYVRWKQRQKHIRILQVGFIGYIYLWI